MRNNRENEMGMYSDLTGAFFYKHHAKDSTKTTNQDSGKKQS